MDRPQVPEELFALEQIVPQPSRGSATVEMRRAMGDLMLKNLKLYIAAQPVATPVGGG